jgi:hypothetical protein
VPVNGHVTGEWSYVIGAYVLTWVVLLGYGTYLWQTWRAARAAAASSDGARR